MQGVCAYVGHCAECQRHCCCRVCYAAQEVAETFLRCVKERFAEDNVVIELNALKIAEDRSFADCARYILTTLLALCLPAPAWVSPEYVLLFASDVPDSNAKEGKLQLLARFKKQMTKWQALLRRFLTSEDDQVRPATAWGTRHSLGDRCDSSMGVCRAQLRAVAIVVDGTCNVCGAPLQH
jgi:hypothetical protein